MLIVASAVFLYYSVWTLLMVCVEYYAFPFLHTAEHTQPFVDPDQPIQNLFPPRVWAIRLPVILILLGSAVVGSFLGVVMIRSNRKRAAKAKAAGKKKA